MKQILLMTVEVECERGDDATTIAKDLTRDQWDNNIRVNDRPVFLMSAKFLTELAR